MTVTKCAHTMCWQPTLGQHYFCSLHLKMYRDQAAGQFKKIFDKVGKDKWKGLLDKVKLMAERDDKKQIQLDKYLGILKEYGIKYTD